MQPSAMAPRAKTAASLSFQDASSVVVNLACGNSKNERMHLMQELIALERELFSNRRPFVPIRTTNGYHLIDNISRQTNLARILVGVCE